MSPKLIIVGCIYFTLAMLVNGVPFRRVAAPKYSKPVGVVFPDAIQVFPEAVTNFVLESPPACAGNNSFCEQIGSYPRKHFKMALRDSPFEALLSKSIGKEIFEEMRLGEENFLCSSVKRMVFPQAAYNIKKKWKYIFNENYNQGVEVEVCSGGQDLCHSVQDLLLGIDTTKCVQKFLVQRLVSLDHQGRPIEEYFPFPSACACSYTFGIDFRPR